MRHRLAVSLLLATSIGCGPEDRAPSGADAEAAFRASLEQPCGKVAAAGDALEGAEGSSEARELAEDLIAEQRRFLSALDRLDPPPAAADAFSRYRDALGRLVALNEESDSISDTEEAVERNLDAATAGLEAWEAKDEAGLPASCPPPNEDDVYLFLFMAQANASCLELGDEIEQDVAGVEGAHTRREGVGEAAVVFREASESIAAALRDALPPELEEPAVGRLIRLHEERAEAFGRLVEAFEARDRAAYERAAADERRAAIAAERLAFSLGLQQCMRLLGVRAT